MDTAYSKRCSSLVFSDCALLWRRWRGGSVGLDELWFEAVEPS